MEDNELSIEEMIRRLNGDDLEPDKDDGSVVDYYRESTVETEDSSDDFEALLRKINGEDSITYPPVEEEFELNTDLELNDIDKLSNEDESYYSNTDDSEPAEPQSESSVEYGIPEFSEDKEDNFTLPTIEDYHDDSIEGEEVEDVYEDELSEPEMKKPEEAKDVIVSPDGYTLEEMLSHRRGGAVKIDKEIDEYLSGIREVTVNGRTKKDKTYVKHANRIENESKKTEGLVKSSKKFIQRNARYTEEEKAIMRNLGLTPEGLRKMMSKKSGLTDKDKGRIISMGIAGNERYFKGKRFRATIGDRDIIQFLAKFKFANTRIISRLRGEPVSRTWRKLQRLKTGGIVADREVIGMGTIWFLTEAGMAFSGYSFMTYRRNSGKTSQMPPIIGANHVAACLWNHSLNVLSLDDYPANNRLIPKKGEKEYVRGETLISELEIRSSLGREANPAFGGVRDGATGNQYAAVGETARAIWHEWNSHGRDKMSPEFELGNEFLWVLYPDSRYTKSFHVPDLILRRERDDDGTPRSIAVEIELNKKSYNRYMETLMAYKLDEDIYEKVIWVTTNASIMRMLSDIATEIGLTKFDVVPMMNEDGLYKNPDIWHI